MNELFTDLHACINCLGSSYKGKFSKEVDTNVSLRDILRYLRRESNQCEIRMELGKFNVVEKCLIPLLKSNHHDSILFDLIIRIVMNLTQPAFICFKQTLPTDILMMEIYIKIDKILQKYKSLWTDRELLAILISSINAIFNKVFDDRSEDEHMMVERILILIRNVLHIKTSDFDKLPDGVRSEHDNLVMALMETGWQELLIYLSNTDDETRFSFHTLEIISLIFREQKSEYMIISDSDESAADLQCRQRLRRHLELAEMSQTTPNSRANRFGGSFELVGVKSTSGRPMIYHHDVTTQKIDLSRDSKRMKKPKNRVTNTEEIHSHRSTGPVLKTLQEFCLLFLQFGYNPLMSAARASLVRNQMQADDETYFMWALRFFMSVCRLAKCDPTFVSETMSVELFHLVYTQAMVYRDAAVSDKNRTKSYYRKLQLTIGAYNEMLQFLMMLDRHTDEKYRKLSAFIKCKVFYQEEYLDLYPTLLSGFNRIKQSRAQLRDLIEGANLMFRILNDRKSPDIAVVRRMRKKRRKVKQRKAQKTMPTPMPSDDAAELLPIWEGMIDELRSAVRGEVELPDRLPNILDILANDTGDATKSMETELKVALGIVQSRLRLGKSLEAVALFRMAQRLWPEAENIRAISNDNDGASIEDREMSILRVLMMEPAFYRSEDISNGAQSDNSDHSDGIGSEIDDDDDTLVEHEVPFDMRQYVLKFCHPRIITCYGTVLGDFATNPASTNASLIRMLYRIAHDHKMPYVLYRLRLLRACATFLDDPVAKLDQYREMRKFAVFLTRQFSEHALTNPKLLVEISFENSPKEAYEAVFGYESEHDDDDKAMKWTDELDDELRKLFEEAQNTEDILPGLDAVHVVENRFSDQNKTRRQIVGRLINLGLMKSVKELRKSRKRTMELWTDDEQTRLIILFEESRTQPKPIRDIMNGLKATTIDPTQLRSQRVVVRKLLELGVVTNVEQLGIKSRVTKDRAPHYSSGSENASDNENDGRLEMDEEDGFLNEIFDNAMSTIDALGGRSVKRVPPPPKVTRLVDWTAFKMTYARLNDAEKQWFVEMLVDNIDSRANGIVGNLAIIPLVDSESDILDSDLVKKLLSLCCFLYPDSNGNRQQFWRIPEDITAKELEYFRNCATSLTPSELEALTMTEFSSKGTPKAPSDIQRKSKTDYVKRQEKMNIESDSETEDNKENSTTLRTKQKSLKSTLFGGSSSSESDNNSDIFEEQPILNSDYSYQKKVFDSDNEDSPAVKRNKRTILDSDEETKSPSTLSKRQRIVDEDSD